MTAFDDWHAVQNLLFTFAELTDLGRLDDAVALFEHATYSHEHVGEGMAVVHRGSADVKAAVLAGTRFFPDGTPRTRHVISNVVIDLDGDVATARSYLTVFQQTDTLPLQPVASGRYVDRFERVDGSWRWADRVIRAGFLVGDISQHSLGAQHHR